MLSKETDNIEIYLLFPNHMNFKIKSYPCSDN